MRYFRNYDLYKHNSMRLHSIAEDYYEPESLEELLSLLQDREVFLKGNFYILGGGSNLLMPPIIKKPVVSIGSIDNSIIVDGNHVSCGASVKIQTFIREMQKYGLGGIEYLYSLPCQVGGAVCMNAGRGKKYNRCISDYIENVTCLDLDTLEIINYSKQDCQFSHRHSRFQNGNSIVLEVTMSLDEKNSEEIENDIKERLDISKKYLDSSKPSCGSVFSQCNGHIMNLLKGIRIGGAKFSSKTTNWISNIDNASYRDIRMLINIAKLTHKILLQKCHLEIKIWK